MDTQRAQKRCFYCNGEHLFTHSTCQLASDVLACVGSPFGNTPCPGLTVKVNPRRVGKGVQVATTVQNAKSQMFTITIEAMLLCPLPVHGFLGRAKIARPAGARRLGFRSAQNPVALTADFLRLPSGLPEQRQPESGATAVEVTAARRASADGTIVPSRTLYQAKGASNQLIEPPIESLHVIERKGHCVTLPASDGQAELRTAHGAPVV